MPISYFQLGTNATAANNITLRGNDDGTLSICSGNPGSEVERFRFKDFGSLTLKQPTQTKLLSGSGTYTTPANCLYLRVRMVGGGGGGGANTAGTNGGNTTFGTTFLVANGGIGGLGSDDGKPGGTASFAAPAIGIAVNGSGSSGCVSNITVGYTPAGGPGGCSPFGGAGVGGYNTAGTAAAVNSGSGGGGGSCDTSINITSSGGSAGGYVEVLIPNPDASYTYAVGARGNAGIAGGGYYGGGNGGSGIIIIDEHYF